MNKPESEPSPAPSTARRWLFRRFPGLYKQLGLFRKAVDETREPRKFRNYSARHFTSGDSLVEAHYETWVRSDLADRKQGLRLAIHALEELPATIVETGTSAWGVDSTRLFDAYVKTFGGQFWTLDIRPEPSRRLSNQLCIYSQAIIGDSVNSLQKLRLAGQTVNLLYLDSWDLDWENPKPAANHCFKEWRAALPICARGTLVLIDDTPKTLNNIPNLDHSLRPAAARYLSLTGRMPGKGELVLQEVRARNDLKVIHHEYSLLFRFV